MAWFISSPLDSLLYFCLNYRMFFLLIFFILKQSALSIMHDVFDNVKPLNVCNLFTYSAKAHHHNARFSVAGNFYLQYSRTDHLRNSFSSICANIWNSIPHSDHALPKYKFKDILQNISHWIFWHKRILMLPFTL